MKKKFKRYPFFKPSIHLIYSSRKSFSSSFFLELIIQITSKNSKYYRYSRSFLGDLIASFNQSSIEVPKDCESFIGIVKNDIYTLFELDDSQNPIFVWRKIKNNWVKELFLGLPLISNYSLNEFRIKKHLIVKALKVHKKNLLEIKPFVHGDLTHFNILFNKESKIIFIDQKKHKNSPLFDFFYFSSYLKNSIRRNLEMNKNDKLYLYNLIDEIICSICNYSDNEKLMNDLNSIIISKDYSLLEIDLLFYLKEFKNLLKTNFKS